MLWTSPFHKSLDSPLSCPRSQAKTESCRKPRSRFLAVPVTLIVEQLVDVPTPCLKTESSTQVQHVVEGLVEVFTHFSQDRVEQPLAELICESPAISPTEKISEKVVNTHVQRVVC